MDDQAIETKALQNGRLFLYGIEEFYLVVLLQDHAGMREKGQQGTLQLVFPSVGDQSFEDFPVANMHTIECSNGHHTGLPVVVIGKTLNG